jgi:DNA-binding GntR family transcriptional regulator
LPRTAAATAPARGLEPVARPSSLRERAAIAIRAGIITGDIRAGEIYSAPALASTLGVSATPVREAMLDLANEGLVEAIPNRGFRVIPLTQHDYDEIFELRLYLEVPAVVGLVGRPELRDPAFLERLNGILKELEEHATRGDLVNLIDTDRQFHMELLKLTGNGRLVELVDRLRVATRRYGMRNLDAATLMAIATDHKRIFDALLDGDRKTVRRVMEEHLEANRGVLAAPYDAVIAAAT